MARLLLLKSGEIISENTPKLSIYDHIDHMQGKSYVINYDCDCSRRVLLAEVLVYLPDISKKDLLCSTHYPPSSSPASSQSAATSPIKNTLPTPLPASHFLQELCKLQMQVVILMQQLSAVISAREASTKGSSSDE